MHAPMAKPFDEELRQKLIIAAKELQITCHKSGTVITIEGPRFSTIAESRMFQLWGADVINMSTAPECALANEAGIPYAAVALSTDYDCWKQDEEAVTWEEVLKVFKANTSNVINLLLKVIEEF
jgi:5'-methylthioadenosine phosphorylase